MPDQPMPRWDDTLVGEWVVWVMPELYSRWTGRRGLVFQSGCDSQACRVNYHRTIFGTHIHGTYRREPANCTAAEVVVRRPMLEGDPTTVTMASSLGRIEGTCVVTTSNFLAECVGPVLIVAEHPKPPTGATLRTTALAVYPLRADFWVMATYHIFTSDDKQSLYRTLFWHLRTIADEPVTSSTIQPPAEPPAPVSAPSLVDLERRLEELEAQLVETRQDHEAAADRLEQTEADLDEAEDEVWEAEFGLFALGDPADRGESRPTLLDFIATGHGRCFDLTVEQYEAKGEIDRLAGEIEALEAEIDEVQDRLDAGATAWVEEQYRAALAVVARHGGPTDDWCGLMPAAAASRLTDDTRLILGTVPPLLDFYTSKTGSDLDWGPLISAMAKSCERILSDFLEPRCRAIACDLDLTDKRLVAAFAETIPAEDAQFAVNASSLGKVFKLIRSDEPMEWSGVRNAAVGLLLFGRRIALGSEPAREVNNPLGLHGTEAERTALRCDLYQFQKLRNGFIHHDPADRAQGERVRDCFERCLRQLAFVLFGVTSTP